MEVHTNQLLHRRDVHATQHPRLCRDHEDYVTFHRPKEPKKRKRLVNIPVILPKMEEKRSVNGKGGEREKIHVKERKKKAVPEYQKGESAGHCSSFSLCDKNETRKGISIFCTAASGSQKKERKNY